MVCMSDVAPTPGQAQAALAEAATQAARVRTADKGLRLILLVLAATYVGAVSALVFVHGALAFPLVFCAGSLGCVVIFARMRVFSRRGKRRFAAASLVFAFWNTVVAGASVMLGWYAPGSPPWHFAASAAVAALPLLGAAALIGRGSR
jgi:hypothetical protein